MDLQLTDRVFVVTGGSRGLGRATADALVAEGARVVVTGRSAESLRVVRDELGAACTTVEADNSDPSTPARLVEAARDTWGRLDGALISVGGPPKGPVATITDEQWTSAFETVFLGAVRLARDLGAAVDAGGSLALVLSSSARVPLPDMALSNGLRPGLAMVAKTLADELGPAGVRVNGLLPGRIATDRIVELDSAAGDPAVVRQESEATIPLRRYGDPEEFGRVAAFILSPVASYVTGAMVPVDGGALRTV